MNAADKIARIEQILTRAAEQVGDVTAPTMERFYNRYPEAKAAFELHGLGQRAVLEGQMIERSLYCLMHWFDSPGEIEILLAGSVPHHSDTLQVPPEWYGDLIEATAEVIAETIPVTDAEELAVWHELRSDLIDLIDQSRQLIAKRPGR